MKELQNSLQVASRGVILGKEEEVILALACFFAGGHLLIEDTPGMGKTTFAKLISKLLGLEFMRVQFTSDLLPSDLVGTNIYNTQTAEFGFFKGPIFTNILLGDELNRASPKTQSALLQAMEEREVSIDRVTHQLSDDFFVMATQNPNTQIGTNLLPESQLDRFMLCINLGYPSKENELKLLKGASTNQLLEEIKPIFNSNEIQKIKSSIQDIHISEILLEKIYEILQISRTSNKFAALSPRCGMDLVKCLKSYCYLKNKDHVTPDDLKLIAPKVISHRLRSNGTSGALANEIIQQIKFDN